MNSNDWYKYSRTERTHLCRAFSVFIKNLSLDRKALKHIVLHIYSGQATIIYLNKHHKRAFDNMLKADLPKILERAKKDDESKARSSEKAKEKRLIQTVNVFNITEQKKVAKAIILIKLNHLLGSDYTIPQWSVRKSLSTASVLDIIKFNLSSKESYLIDIFKIGKEEVDTSGEKLLQAAQIFFGDKFEEFTSVLINNEEPCVRRFFYRKIPEFAVLGLIDKDNRTRVSSQYSMRK